MVETASVLIDDIHEGEMVNEAALKELICAAAMLNVAGKGKAKRVGARKAD